MVSFTLPRERKKVRFPFQKFHLGWGEDKAGRKPSFITISLSFATGRGFRIFLLTQASGKISLRGVKTRQVILLLDNPRNLENSEEMGLETDPRRPLHSNQSQTVKGRKHEPLFSPQHLLSFRPPARVPQPRRRPRSASTFGLGAARRRE